MQRREFIKAIAGSAVVWPLAARAQQSAMPVIGVLHGVSAAQWADRMVGFHQGLRETGYSEGRNVTIEYRWADGQFERLPTMAADLVSRKVAVICAGAGDVAIREAMAATKTIPVVFTTASDPVRAEETSRAPLLWESSLSPSGWSCCMRSFPASRGLPSL